MNTDDIAVTEQEEVEWKILEKQHMNKLGQDVYSTTTIPTEGRDACQYCKKDALDIYSDGHEYMWVEGSKLVVEAHNIDGSPTVQFEEDIKFCPMCSRKL